MKNIILAGIAVITVCAAPAFAADLPVRKAAPMAVAAPAPTWTGCYIAAGGGYAMHNADHIQRNAAGVQIANNATEGGRGWLATVQGGCDYQFATNWVIGAFADYDYSNIKGDYHDRFNDIVGPFKQKSSWAAGGRVGYLVTPTLLSYFSAGYTQTRIGQINTVTIGFPPVPTNITYAAHNMNGWFIGSGVEYALNFVVPGLFWKTEYRFSSFGSKDSVQLTAGVPNGFVDSQKLYTQAVRSELVWRFSSR